MNYEQVGGLVRHVLTFGGGYLVSKGIVDGGFVETAVPAIMTLFGLGWSYTAKRNA